jgi:outer membrane protein assembly factor BamB
LLRARTYHTVAAVSQSDYSLKARIAAVWFALSVLATPVIGRSDVPTLTNEWSVFLGVGSASTAAVAPEGTIYVGTLDGRLLAVKPGGPVEWIFKTGREIRTAPAIGSDGTIYFGSRDRNLYAVRSDGRLRWRFKTGAWVDSSACIGPDGTVYFGSWDDSLYALTPEGVKKWQFTTSGEVVGSPVIGRKGCVYFGSHDCRFYAVTPEGKTLWLFKTGGPIISSAAVDTDETLYFSSVDGFVYALRSDGSLKWKLRTGGITTSSPVIGEQGLIFIGANDRLWVISQQGVKKMEIAYSEGLIEGSPLALADGSACFVSSYMWLASIGPQNNYNWVHPLVQGSFSPCASSQGSLLVIEHEVGVGDSLCSLRVGVALSESPWPTWRGNPKNTGRLRTP